MKYVYLAPAGDDTGSGGGDSLLDGNADGGEGGEGTGGSSGENGEWFLAEGVPGEGERPEYYKADKYKSLADQAKAYVDLEGKLGGFTGAPEDYELSLPEGFEGKFRDDDPLLGWFKETAKESNMSQDTFTKLLHGWIEKEGESHRIDREREIADLGSNAKARLANIADWGKKNLTDDGYEGLLEATKTALGVKFVEQVIQMGRPSKQPRDGVSPTSGMTSEKLRSMRYKSDEHGNLLINIDPQYRREVEKAYKDYYGEEPEAEVVGR